MDIYVGNLSYDTTEKTLRDAFAAHGAVAKVKIPIDFNTGQPKGFAFVTMDDWKEGNAAIKALDGADVDGRPIRVNQAREREQRPAGGPGGGGGGGYGQKRGRY